MAATIRSGNSCISNLILEDRRRLTAVTNHRYSIISVLTIFGESHVILDYTVDILANYIKII